MKHICQSEEWALFKTAMGTPAVKAGDIWFTVHSLPQPFKALPWKVGYCPKVEMLTKQDIKNLEEVGQKNHCVFIKIESNVIENRDNKLQMSNDKLQMSARTFASHTLLLDLTKTEEELLAGMHPKTRYNIKVAERHGVTVEEKNDEEGLAIFLKLQKETAARQKFYVHPDSYYRTLWETLQPAGMVSLLLAKLGDEYLGALMLFKYGDTFYYPYGGTADTHRDSMFGTLLMWEAVKLGKKLGCKVFDMWGAAAGDDPKDPWNGFTRFKKGFGGRLVKFEDTYDLVLNKPLYFLLTLGNKIRWLFLRLAKH